MVKRLLFVASVLWMTTSARGQAQTLSGLTVSFDGEKLSILYDLNDADPKQKYKVYIYSSHDNYLRPLSLAIGDFGETVLPGKRKHVVWDAKSTLPADFDSDILVKLRATKIVAPALNMQPLLYNVYKRGKTVNINWTGGEPSDGVNLDLYRSRGGQIELVQSLIKNMSNSPGNQSYSWQMPSSVKAGKKYFIRVSKSDKPTAVAGSQFFDVKPRTPFIVKVLPFLAVGAGVYFLTGSKSENSSNQLTELPGPTKP